MWTQAGAPPPPLLLLLLACCLFPAGAQRQSIWDEPIRFATKAKDSCGMTVTGHGQDTRLRVACQSNKRSYWCEYVGRPHLCRTYNKNPRHYFVQMMWGMRKLFNACQAPRVIKPHMCRNAPDESQMVFSRSWPETPGARPGRPQPSRPQPSRPQPSRPQPRPAPAGPDAARQAAKKSVRIPEREASSPRPSQTPTTPAAESNRKRIARRYCWRSLQGFCSFFIGLFRH